jgi:hypothetical protein
MSRPLPGLVPVAAGSRADWVRLARTMETVESWEAAAAAWEAAAELCPSYQVADMYWNKANHARLIAADLAGRRP